MKATVIVTAAVSVAGSAAVVALPHGPATSAPRVAMRPAVLVAPVDRPLRHRAGNTAASVPPVLFGTGDALPKNVSGAEVYDASVLVWCALGTGGGTARLEHGPVVTLIPGKAVPVPATTAGVATVHVHALVGGKDYERTYQHTVSDG